MCRCRDALRRLAIRKIDRREHPSRVRRPFHTHRKPGKRQANLCEESPRLQIHAPKSCANHAAGSRLHVPNKKTVYTPGPDPSGSTHRRLHRNIARAVSAGRGGVPRGPRRPRAMSKSTVRRGARGRRIFYAVAGAVACSVQSRGCPHVLTLVGPATPRFRRMFSCQA